MTQSRRIVFLDVDGTLVDHEGNLAPTTPEAVRQARANGHLVYLCTGRAITDIVDSVRQLELDGVMTNSGAFTQIGETIVAAHTMSRTYLDLIRAYLDEQGALAFLQANDGVYADDRSSTQLTAYFAARGLDVHEFIRFTSIDNADLDQIAKITFFSEADDALDRVASVFGDDLDIVPASIHLATGSGGEVTPKGVNKGSAITAELARLGLKATDAIGIGDSHNDLDMFRAVGTSVAMGNAVAELKAIADAETTEVLDDGIRNAFLALDLIDR